MERLAHPINGELFTSPVSAGTGWPDDPARLDTPVVFVPEEVARGKRTLRELDALVTQCRACPRLVEWREKVAQHKRAAFADQPYWGRPVPGWGSPTPTVLVVGLAPAAHGGNRTGRVFTGDRSGDWLYAGLYRAGLANQPTSTHAGDNLQLIDTRVLAAVRCAPPDNKPTTIERDNCKTWLDQEMSLVLSSVRVIVCLGSYAWDATLRSLADGGVTLPRPKPRFGHGVEVPLGSITLIGCYHPSQQNTFTGRLTEPMLDQVLGRAATLRTPD